VKGSRFRAPRSRCRSPRGPGLPRRVMSCGDGSALVEWAPRAIVVHEPLLGPLLAPWPIWDRHEQERAFVAAELAAWPFPGAWGRRPAAAPRYVGRASVEPPPMRQRGVAGDLAAALVAVPDRRNKVRRAA